MHNITLERALSDYCAALQAAAQTSADSVQRRTYELRAIGLKHVQHHYTESGDLTWCLRFIESEKVFYESSVIDGDAAPALRATFGALLRLVPD